MTDWAAGAARLSTARRRASGMTDGADVLAELSGSTPTATFIRSLSIDEPFIRKLSGGDEFYETDALGSSLVMTDGAGASQTTYTYEPFGKTRPRRVAHRSTHSNSPDGKKMGRDCITTGRGITVRRCSGLSPKIP